MEYLGSDATHSYPDLKDISNSMVMDIYIQVITIMRVMFNKCHLVHGDLSEFNLLLSPQGVVYVIDVSQSVEHDHYQALDFLKRDIVNITRFFRKTMINEHHHDHHDDQHQHQLHLLHVNTLFDFIITPDVPSIHDILLGSEDELLLELLPDTARTHLTPSEQRWLLALLSTNSSSNDEDDDEERLFLDTWIPSTLNQFSDLMEMEEELSKHAKGERSVYNRLLATHNNNNKDDNNEEDDDDHDDEDEGQQQQEEEEEEEESNTDHAADVVGGGGNADGHIPEGITKSEWKKIVKERRRAKLETKCPKHLKKRYRAKAANR
ncbi:serine/threonine-protein kinase rio1, putative [Perkinsus marinus ATCC 50983]|uniref:non-specific serine/threonine protein kinase n=1 Tax=Perkinsus marinus (strain ATCC 50983 / TXsc) TaxID=423536 RepID=C5KEY5_PERM5|nr:serine/threonine-protein kinase rio1, putative [Perkinsus marinus ATCC 50983]EER16958.1 serine/threonine-protein kinase rio1, putative [Perkinsus marinus ATCC 50983]|eukprot:XP_002785162.1 serine/threonine-protein kinase rio1, putative [Perkinsus marinus ATCC 50983]